MTNRSTLIAALALALAACHSEDTRNKIAAAENGSQELNAGVPANPAAENGAQPQ